MGVFVFQVIFTISLTSKKRCAINREDMSKRRFGNLLKRKFLLSLKKIDFLKSKKQDEWGKSQLLGFSRFGGEIVVMSLGR